eukprot:UN09378
MSHPISVYTKFQSTAIILRYQIIIIRKLLGDALKYENIEMSLNIIGLTGIPMTKYVMFWDFFISNIKRSN